MEKVAAKNGSEMLRMRKADGRTGYQIELQFMRAGTGKPGRGRYWALRSVLLINLKKDGTMSEGIGQLTESEKNEAFRIAAQIESLLSGMSQEKRSRVMYAFNILFSELGKDLRSAANTQEGE